MLFATRITGSGKEDHALEAARFLRDLPERDPNRQILLAAGGRLPLSLADISTAELAAVELLAQLEKTGRLSVFPLPADRFGPTLPRLFAQGSDGAIALWRGVGDQPLLASLLGEHQHIATRLDDAAIDDLLAKLNVGQRVPGAFAGILGNVHVWDLPAGTLRDFGVIFAPIRGALARLEIEDPFLLKDDRARRSVIVFLSRLKAEGAKIDFISLTWRENHPHEQSEQAVFQRTEMERLLKAAGHADCPVALHHRPYTDRRAFHDRVVRIEIADQNGGKRHLQWDLSSGVGNLMDPSCEAKVYLRIQ